MKVLNYTGLQNLWTNIRNYITAHTPTKTSDLTNDSNFVDTSNSAVSSGITSAKVTSYDSHVADTDIHVTTADKNKWNNQTYVFRYSSTALVASSTNSNTLLDNTDNLKVGDKVIDVNGKIFSVVSVDTANQTVTVGSALVDLALDANVVHTSGNETVGGKKTFSDDLTIYNYDSSQATKNLNISSSKIQVGDTSNSDAFGIRFNAGASFVAQILAVNDTTGTQNLQLSIRTKDGSDNYITSMVRSRLSANGNSSFEPGANDSISLGSSVFKWKSVYATNYYYGSNNIEFSTKFVTSDTAQTISGEKTFSSSLRISNSDTTVTTPDLNLKNYKADRGTTDSAVQAIQFLDKNGKALTTIESRRISNGNTTTNILCYNTDDSNNTVSGGVSIIKTKTDTNFAPNADNAVTCGRSFAKWSDVQTYQINGLTPSSLGMPNIANKIDISSYITDLAGVNNEYTPTVNGWIGIRSANATKISILDSATNIGNQSVSSTATYLTVMAPVIANRKVYINVICTSLEHAYFIPCQGNV